MDYLKNNLLHCSTCHQPKETIIRVLGRTKKVNCLCACEKKDRDGYYLKVKEAQHNRRIQDLRLNGFSDKKLRQWTFENDNLKNPRLTKIAKNFVKNFREFSKNGKGLLFAGRVGSGKTYMSACIANALISQGVPVLMTSFPDIANRYSEDFDERAKFIRGLKNYSLVIFDDLGVERKSDYMNEIVTNVIDTCYRSGISMVISTNLTSEEMFADLNRERIYSRILEVCSPITVDGENERNQLSIYNYNRTRQILGGKK